MLNSCYMYFITTYARAQAHTHAELFGDRSGFLRASINYRTRTALHVRISAPTGKHKSSVPLRKQSSVSSHHGQTAHRAWALGIMAGKRAGRGPQGLGLHSPRPQERRQALISKGMSTGRAGFGGSANWSVSDKVVHLKRHLEPSAAVSVQSLPVWSPRGPTSQNGTEQQER